MRLHFVVRHGNGRQRECVLSLVPAKLDPFTLSFEDIFLLDATVDGQRRCLPFKFCADVHYRDY